MNQLKQTVLVQNAQIMFTRLAQLELARFPAGNHKTSLDRHGVADAAAKTTNECLDLVVALKRFEPARQHKRAAGQALVGADGRSSRRAVAHLTLEIECIR